LRSEQSSIFWCYFSIAISYLNSNLLSLLNLGLLYFKIFISMEKESINLNEMASKCQTKSDLYEIMKCEGSLYLLPYKYCTVDFIADILEGKKKVLFLFL
jgi:hypothetical protein